MSLYQCLKCGKKVGNMHQRYFVIPVHIWVPTEHYLCDEHKDIRYTFEDVYNDNGTRNKELTKEEVVDDGVFIV
jgi:hypothetical protein